MEEVQQGLFDFMRQESGKLLTQTLEHVGLTFISLLIAVLIGVPTGILIRKNERLASVVLGFTGVLQTIPSIALLGFLIPLAGIGAKPAIIALLLYALLPIVRNTYTGIVGVNPALVEAATAMGMTPVQVLRRVQLPLALPVIFAGIRTATVINVGVATLAAYIAAGGLGEDLFGGLVPGCGRGRDVDALDRLLLVARAQHRHGDDECREDQGRDQREFMEGRGAHQ